MRRLGRWAGGAVVLALVVLLVLPYLLPFTSSGTLTEQQAAAASLGAEPTFVPLQGIDVYVERFPATDEVASAGAVPLLVVIHGFGASAATWRPILPALAALGEVVAYDRPSFGFTERPGSRGPVDPYGTEGQLELLSALIDAFRSDDPDRPVVLLGHSAGGALAAEFALRRREQVDALVLVAPAVLTGGGTPRWLRPILDAMGHVPHEESPRRSWRRSSSSGRCLGRGDDGRYGPMRTRVELAGGTDGGTWAR